MSQGWSYVLAGRVGLRSISSHARSLENANPFQNADKDLSQEFTKQQGQFQTERNWLNRIHRIWLIMSSFSNGSWLRRRGQA